MINAHAENEREWGEEAGKERSESVVERHIR